MPERGYEVVPLSPTRLLTIDLLHGFRRKRIVHGLMEADVTLPRRRLREIEARTGERLSFSAFLIQCLARAFWSGACGARGGVLESPSPIHAIHRDLSYHLAVLPMAAGSSLARWVRCR
jgi:hypothetical protein